MALQHGLPESSFYLPSFDCQVRGVDALYSAAFGEISNGIFVEVGAFDGQGISNTCFLADIGWRGVYVEPVPEVAKICSARHQRNPNVVIVPAAVGKEPGTTQLHIAGVLSTQKEEFYSAYKNISWASELLSDRKISVPMVTLNDLLTDQMIPHGFELLVVDVEGAEPDVFAGFDLARWKPKMLIVELEDRHPDFRAIADICAPITELRKRILSHGYTEVYVDSINTVFRAIH